MISRSTQALIGMIAATASHCIDVSAAEPAATVQSGAHRGVAALGRLEPAGGIVRITAPSVPDAVMGGIVSKLLVDRGQDVKEGQALAEIDTAPVAAARINQAEADLETARRDAVAAASLADEACVLADVAQRTFKRKGELLNRGMMSKEESENAQGDAEAGAASCKARGSAARVAESRIVAAQAQLTERRAEYERTQVRAPFAGRVLDINARPGELPGPSGILELGRVDQMFAIAEVYEADVRFVEVGQRANVHSEALSQDIGGIVTRIRPKVQKLDEIGDDPAARKDAKIVEVEIRLDDSKPVANLSNLQVEVRIGR